MCSIRQITCFCSRTLSPRQDFRKGTVVHAYPGVHGMGGKILKRDEIRGQVTRARQKF